MTVKDIMDVIKFDFSKNKPDSNSKNNFHEIGSSFMNVFETANKSFDFNQQKMNDFSSRYMDDRQFNRSSNNFENNNKNNQANSEAFYLSSAYHEPIKNQYTSDRPTSNEKNSSVQEEHFKKSDSKVKNTDSKQTNKPIQVDENTNNKQADKSLSDEKKTDNSKEAKTTGEVKNKPETQPIAKEEHNTKKVEVKKEVNTKVLEVLTRENLGQKSNKTEIKTENNIKNELKPELKPEIQAKVKADTEEISNNTAKKEVVLNKAGTKEIEVSVNSNHVKQKDVKNQSEKPSPKSVSSLNNEVKSKLENERIITQIKEELPKIEVKEEKTTAQSAEKDDSVKNMIQQEAPKKATKTTPKANVVNQDKEEDKRPQENARTQDVKAEIKTAEVKTTAKNSDFNANQQKNNQPEISLKSSNNTFIHNSIQKDAGAKVAQFDKVFNTTQTKQTNQSVMNQVLDKVSSQINANKSEVTIALRPENLGRVNLNIVNEKGVLTAKITAENNQVKEAITKGLESLRGTLAEQGVQVGKIVVNVNETQNSNNQNADQSFKFDQHGQNSSQTGSKSGNQNNPTNQASAGAEEVEGYDFEEAQEETNSEQQTDTIQNTKVDYTV